MTLQSRRALNRWVAMAGVSALAAAVAIATLSVPKTVDVEIINEGTTPDEATFVPGTISIQPGTTVTWTNADASTHTVTSRAQSGFDSGVMGPGEAFHFMFESKATFDYYCKIHPAMVGRVTVE